MQEIEKLREISNLYKINKYHSETARMSEEEYINQKHPKPQKKPIEPPPPKKRAIVQLTIFTVSIILFAVILIVTISTYVTNAKYNKLISDPGEEYRAWIENFPNVSTVEELEETWKPVEQAWAEQGIAADWSFVEDAMKGYRINNADSLDSCISNALSETWREKNTSAAAGVPFVILFAVIAFIFGRKGKGSLNDYRKKMDYFKKFTVAKNEENQKYNETTYVSLLESWEKSYVIYRSEYNIAIAQAKEGAERTKNELLKYSSILPLSQQANAGKYADLIENGLASSLADAINIVNNEKAQARQAYEAKIAAQDAQKKQAEADRLAHKSLVERQNAAIRRCGSCIHYHNNSCSYSIRTSYKNSGDVCPSYRPKTK